jgi:uncharacterized RDD family membrane protein YckC
LRAKPRQGTASSSYFWALFDDRNRAWHDILFTTEVRHS